jgi:hypothetical protein
MPRSQRSVEWAHLMRKNGHKFSKVAAKIGVMFDDL